MISKNTSKLITSLSIKKKRDELSMFIAEGSKLIYDLALSFKCEILIATTQWIADHEPIEANQIIETTIDDLKKISNQLNPQGVLAVFRKPSYQFDITQITEKLSIALDDVQDPGNLGTIIRIADWFGISDIFCSEHSADAYSPKAVQACMGALSRVRVHYVEINGFLNLCNGKLPIYGTFMNGENIYEKSLSNNGIILMGNEGKGISEELGEFVTERLLIPNYPKGELTSESLNVGVATALVCAEFRRKN